VTLSRTIAFVCVVALAVVVFFTGIPRSLSTTLTGTSPFDIAISPDGRYVYAANGGAFANYSVSVIDTVAGAVISDIPIGLSPSHIAVSPDGRRVYVTGDSEGAVVIDATTNSVVTTIPTDSRLGDVAVSPDSRHVYIASHGNGVLVVDAAANAVAATIPTETSPLQVAVSPNGRRVYVISDNNSDGRDINGTMSVIDPTADSVVSTTLIGVDPHGLAVSPDGRYVYVANRGGSLGDFTQIGIQSGSVSVIDAATSTIKATIPTRARSVDIALGPNGRFAYVTNYGGYLHPLAMEQRQPGSISVVDMANRAILADISTGEELPTGAVVGPDGDRVYVGDGNSVLVIDGTVNNSIGSILSGRAVPGWVSMLNIFVSSLGGSASAPESPKHKNPPPPDTRRSLTHSEPRKSGPGEPLQDQQPRRCEPSGSSGPGETHGHGTPGMCPRFPR
jgi:YVTN family beta-propeller protein